MSIEPNFVDVYSAGNVLIAHSVQAALEAAGIQAIIDREQLQNTFGDLPGDTATRILVHESQVDEARAIIAKAEQAIQAESDVGADDNVCLRCGKRLAPNEETCSACGWSFRQADGAESVGPM
jgi:ribosomal protein L40E